MPTIQEEFENSLITIRDRAENGIYHNKKILNNATKSAIEKNRATYSISILEMFKTLADEGLAKKLTNNK